MEIQMDEYVALGVKVSELRAELTAERERADALAAHVERLRKVGDELGYWLSAAIEDSKSCDEFKGACHEHIKAIHESPQTSLAHLKARVAEWVMKSVASGKAPAQVIADIAAGGGK